MTSSTQRSAIGLLYEHGSAPTVSSKGFGELAEHIIEAAQEQGILIHQDADLAKTLEKLDQGQEIPKELYYVIAELIAFSYVLRGKFPPGWQNFSNKLNVKA
ncbi:EscU/YscU/HrcU family type III secretion system export apparatus switch protein [Pseudoalteromonas sp. Cnat2-41]|uniref:EscU/YscU/HrcU family type III secretion system export apparatus switch protein n=1 Tax=unclassified Pseudoalteromonas TaxID=194690 RepID=UPI0006B56F46|nr:MULTISPECIES: EscU/YscU/HrcU family type III secretion system export apparatus switch protein [unclassified Pseudoalteromonas]MCF2863497.1 EscU/YscU/HrcU family type III secretion system export apparatus switch protein [Pseudoalteromonas sp. CNAT2-18]MCG7558450.1 EscU/YscU/HrcU family type III secretion system export apparatus switch protein [Pseudoalteromonas sp. CNAT2-18.1]GAP76137.1 flhB domain protein [Pseudoalteromonas sp. SW0106-04]